MWTLRGAELPIQQLDDTGETLDAAHVCRLQDDRQVLRADLRKAGQRLSHRLRRADRALLAVFGRLTMCQHVDERAGTELDASRIAPLLGARRPQRVEACAAFSPRS